MAIQPTQDRITELTTVDPTLNGPDATATFAPTDANPTEFASSESLYAAGRKSALDEEEEVEDDVDPDLEDDDDELEDDDDDLEDDDEEDLEDEDDDDLEDDDEDEDEDEDDDDDEDEEEEDEE